MQFSRRWLWFWLSLSLALKIVLVLVAGPFYNLHSDDQSYVKTAEIWLQSGMFTYNDPTRPSVFIMPGYPALLLLLMRMFGTGEALWQMVRMLQAVLMTAAMYLLFLIGRQVFSERVGLIAVAICAWYPPFWLVSNLLLTETLFLAALLGLIYAALRFMETFAWRYAVWFALAFVVALYTRPIIALWPVLFAAMALWWRQVPWRVLWRRGAVMGLLVLLCITPWWVRNAHVSNGQVILLTRSSGNPLLLGTFPYSIPSIAVQRTWHRSNDLWANDAYDRKWAMQRIQQGFRERFWLYASWYTVGKFAFLWGKVFYWLPVARIPKWVVVLYHFGFLLPGFYEMWVTRRQRSAKVVIGLLVYASLLYMIYLTHGRYALPFLPFVALFAARFYQRRWVAFSAVLKRGEAE